ncbi:chorismate mutase [Malassezia nana]|uniref:chorismate mutase n=1 Tax=Malassezia nana TaxID=180528 RepID=A0AAF0ELL2_9BASI|nr:chorismate mutase [Malassezia nana]
MTDAINFHAASIEEILSLDRIRATLQRMEETIVFRLIERTQYAHNPAVYEEGAIAELRDKEQWTGSWLTWVIKETESSYAKLGRWLAPDEHPFTPIDQLPSPLLTPQDYPHILHPHHVNVSKEILNFYTKDVVPVITNRMHRCTDDRQYGSAAVCDTEALSAISRRIYFGMFVSESKFRAQPSAFIPHIQSRNAEALAALITKPAVEQVLLERVGQKAEVYGQNLDPGAHGSASLRKIQSQDIVRLYEQYIIPLTKKVEVDYLLERT